MDIEDEIARRRSYKLWQALRADELPPNHDGAGQPLSTHDTRHLAVLRRTGWLDVSA